VSHSRPPKFAGGVLSSSREKLLSVSRWGSAMAMSASHGVVFVTAVAAVAVAVVGIVAVLGCIVIALTKGRYVTFVKTATGCKLGWSTGESEPRPAPPA